MKNIRCLSICVAVVLSVVTSGCGPSPVPIPIETPAQRQAAAKVAGHLSFLAFVAVEKPSTDEQAAIQTVLTQIRANITSFQQNGFISALPDIKKAIADAYPDPADAFKVEIATVLAEDLLNGLDQLYTDHPEWKTMTTEVTDLIGAFLDGATTGFATFKSPGRAHRSAAVKK